MNNQPFHSYAQALREIENMRVDGVFVDAEGNKAEGQYVSPAHRPVEDLD